MTKPNFFILGAPKCGTTSMAAWLSGHPEIHMSPDKEPHFFNFDYGERRYPCIKNYERLFAAASSEHRAVGEASTKYLYSRAAVPAILRYADDPRFIVMIRDPVEMVISLHEQRLFDGDEDEPSFERAWRLKDARAYGARIPRACIDPQAIWYGELCRVGAQLRRLYRSVDRDRVLLIWFDDLKTDSRTEYQRALAFLGVDNDGRSEFPAHNAAKVRRLPAIHRLLQRINHLWRDIGLPPVRTGLTQRVYDWDRRPRDRTPIGEDFDGELRRYFLDDICLLESLTGRNLTAWKPANA